MATQFSRPRFRPLIHVGIAASVIGAILTLWGIWGGVDNEVFWKTVATFWVISYVACHSTLIVANDVARKLKPLILATYIAIAAVGTVILTFMWFEFDLDRHYRALGVLGVITVILTILVPIARKMTVTIPAANPDIGPARHSLSIKPIGIIRTGHHEPKGTPIQPGYAGDSEGEVILDSEFAPGLADLAGFERIWLIYSLHRATDTKLSIIPFRETRERGIFATRAPVRPNHIGMSAVRLISVDGHRLRFVGADMLDETPLLDIKPYSPGFDSFPDAHDGWLADSNVDRTVSDDRFKEE